jgi:hypothetical protein
MCDLMKKIGLCQVFFWTFQEKQWLKILDIKGPFGLDREPAGRRFMKFSNEPIE